MNAFNSVVAQATKRRQRNQELSRPPPAPPPPPPISRFSSALVPNGGWCSQDFMLGAGMVLIQKNTHKVVLLYEKKRQYWFLPRGRKDIGESLEQTALREAYEESGYRAEFFPCYAPSRQPAPPHDRDARHRLHTEPIFMSMSSWLPRKSRIGTRENGGEYFMSWYLGQIAEDAQPEEGTRMPDEQDYETHLLTADEAFKNVWGQEVPILEYAWHVYVCTLELQEKLAQEAETAAQNSAAATEDANNQEELDSEWVTESSTSTSVQVDSLPAK